MEFTEKYKLKLVSLKAALADFEAAMALDTSRYSLDVADLLKNGQIQKFEVCTDLLWKTIRLYLYEKDGIEANSPKQVIRDFFNAGHLGEADFFGTIDMINDRNLVSHVYRHELFEQIHSKLDANLSIMKNILEQMT